MTAKGFAIKEHGEILVATLSATRKAAIINFLVTQRMCMIFEHNTDGEIEAMWQSMKIKAECVEVLIIQPDGETP